MAGSCFANMFSKTGPTITSHRATSLVQANAGEILDSHSDLRCRRWHPAKLRGRSVSSAFPCISFHKRAEGTAGAFQRGKISGLTAHSGNAFLVSLSVNCAHKKATTHSRPG